MLSKDTRVVRVQANPLWPVDTRFPSLERDMKVDVAIIGGGVAGISCAFHLQNAGYRVAVLEKDEVGAGATGASSGILYYGSGGNFVEAMERYGKENATTLWNQTSQTIRDIASLIEKHAIRCDFRHTGAIMVAKNEREEARIEDEHQALEGIGIRTKPLSGEQVLNSFRGMEFAGGLFFDVCCVIHPAQFMAELARKFNVPVYERSPMVSFSEGKDGVAVQTSRATLDCDKLILATNLEPLSGLQRHFGEETTVVLASAETVKIKEVWPEDRVIWTMEDQYDILYPLGRRLALELYQARQVKQKVAKYYGNTPFEIQHRWGDSWSKTSDLLPIAGGLTKRVYAAVAMGDEGIVMGFAVGSRMPKALAGEQDPILRMTAPSRFGS